MSKALNSVPQDDPVCQTNLLSIVPILSHYHTSSCGLCCFLRVTHLVVRFQVCNMPHLATVLLIQYLQVIDCVIH